MPFVLSIFIFAVFTVIHLVCCYLGLERARMVTKCMLIPLLTISLQAYGCNKVLIYCALIFGLIGDLLIVVNNDKMFFMLGMLSFGVNHIFNLITVISLIPFKLNYFYYIGMAVLAVCYIKRIYGEIFLCKWCIFLHYSFEYYIFSNSNDKFIWCRRFKCFFRLYSSSLRSYNI